MKPVVQLFILLLIITVVAFCVTHTLLDVSHEVSVSEMLSIAPITTLLGLIGIAVIASCLALLAAAGFITIFVKE